MPLYEYFCKSCGSYFERRRPASEYALPALCAEGHESARRVVSLFATASTHDSAVAVSTMGCACGAGTCGCGH
jgi:putative FmdB family regulatory protein